MRYTVGQKYYFINVKFTTEQLRWGRLYLPWQDKLESIEVIELTCTEHHKVAGEWDDEAKYDGFRFVDASGNIWNNQYPRAAYGQLDDSADGHVERDYTGLSHDEAFALFEKYSRTEDVKRYMDNILRGLRDLRKEKRQKEAKSLKGHFNEVVRAMRPFGVSVVTEPMILKYTDGRNPKTLTDWHRAKVVPLSHLRPNTDRIKARRRRERRKKAA